MGLWKPPLCSQEYALAVPRIVRCWRNTVTQKYTNLPGTRDLHDFLALKNPDTDAVMKVRENCYAGTLKNTPMRITKGKNPADKAIPGVTQSYAAKCLVKPLSDSKMTHLRRMCRNFIPQEHWHELYRE